MVTQPIAIAVAPNGARKTHADHPALPLTPDELAAEGVCAIIDSIGELLDGDALHS